MKALVTGGAGFIGSHLTECLLNKGHEVTVLDNLCTGTLDNLSTFKDTAALTFIRGDIRDAGLVQLMVRECDMIFHLAAAVGVQLIAEDPVRTIETNIGGTEVILEKANRFGKRIFLASSSEVYGKSEDVPFCEDDDFILGSTSFSRWAYACSKAIDEFLGQAYYQQYGLDVVIGRFFNTIGPKQTGRYGMVVPRFVRWALQQEPIQIYGNGQQTRCFCFVGDVVEAVCELMQQDHTMGQVFNIGSDQEMTIETLADRIIHLTHSHSNKTFVPYAKAYSRPIEDMVRRQPSIERIKQAIAWKPRTSLEQTLKAIIKYEKAEHSR